MSECFADSGVRKFVVTRSLSTHNLTYMSAQQQFHEDNSHREDIHCLIVLLSSEHLWSHVVRRATIGLSKLIHYTSNAKVSDFQHAFQKQDVCGFEILVRNVVRLVKLLYCVVQLLHDS